MSDEVAEIREAIQKSIEALQNIDVMLSMKLEPLMTIEDAAKYWRCSSQHVRNVIAGKEWIGKVIRIGGSIRLQRKDVMSYGVEVEA